MVDGMKHKMESRLLGDISTTSDMQITQPLRQKVKRATLMASGPITSWQINGETMETVTDFNLGSSKIVADGDCSHEIKRRLLLGRKVKTNLDSMLKSRDITLPTKVHLSSQSFGFSRSRVWMWELDYEESWAPKNWCFWTVVLEKTLESPLDCKEIHWSILRKSVLNIHWKDQCWSWNANTLTTWWEELTHWKRPCCLERLRAGGEGDDRGWDGWMASPTQWTCVLVGSRSWWWPGKPGMLQSLGSQRVRHDWVTEMNWTEYKKHLCCWGYLMWCDVIWCINQII